MPRKKAEQTPKVSETKKKPTTKKSTTTKKPVVKKPTTKKKPAVKKEPIVKRKDLPQEQMFPFEAFPFRLEYKDGTETRICHFTCDEHRTKLIERYKLRKGTYFTDDCL